MSSKDFWANYFSLSGTLTENMKKQKNKKREQSLQNSILEKLRSCSVPDLLIFSVKGKCALSKGDLLVCLTQGSSNLLPKLFFCDFLSQSKIFTIRWAQNNIKDSLFCKEMEKVE